MHHLFQKHTDKLRFGIVGVTNTVIDFGILFFLVSLGLGAITGNYISTTAAFVFSFLANRNYTFKSNGRLARQLILFIVVTLVGIWVLQPLTIIIVQQTGLFADIKYQLLGTKLAATIISLAWNYTLYKHVVFKDTARV